MNLEAHELERRIACSTVMADRLDDDSDECICFGPFRLFPAARRIERDGRPLALGNRALDILIVLVEHAGEVVDQRELLSRVWRGLVVGPGNLRVHISALRKALSDSTGEARYIANVTGQGYCFVAPIRRRNDSMRAVANPISARLLLLLLMLGNSERYRGDVSTVTRLPNRRASTE
jgi:DNA-binding winged helix-turn-helix (wHTH) protein